MTQLRNIGLPSCSCGTCGPSSVLSAGNSSVPLRPVRLPHDRAEPDRRGLRRLNRRPAAGRPILIKGGCVLSLDRAVGDFEQADVLIEGSKIAAVRPNISAPNAEVIDAVEHDRDAGLRRHPPAHVAGLPAQRPAGRLARGLLATSCSARSAPR